MSWILDLTLSVVLVMVLGKRKKRKGRKVFQEEGYRIGPVLALTCIGHVPKLTKPHVHRRVAAEFPRWV